MAFWTRLLFSPSVNYMVPLRRIRENINQKKRKRVGLENDLPPLYIPEHIIFSEILPFLSFNELAKLKCVCKSWYSFISSNPMLPLDRFRQKPHLISSSSSSSYSAGVIFPECNSMGQLVFLPTLPLNVPEFLSVSFSQQPCKELVSSTGGLLCLKCTTGNNDIHLYVCNPLTKEGHVIPFSDPWHDTLPGNVHVWRSNIGLAYDSFKSPDQYKLVCPWTQYFEEEEGTLFGFEVFSSLTNKWDKSSYNKYYNKYYSNEEPGYEFFSNLFCRDHDDLPVMKSTYAGGVLYWDCRYFLSFFDPEKGYGGTVWLPFCAFGPGGEDYQIGELKGHVTCTRFSRSRGMHLWIMDVNRSTEWELMHQVSFETVIQTNRYVLRNADMPLRNRKDVKIMFNRDSVIALPYGDDNGGRLFMRFVTRENQDDVLCYDLNSGKLNKFCNLLPATHYYFLENGHSFLYRSSTVSLPKLGN